MAGSLLLNALFTYALNSSGESLPLLMFAGETERDREDDIELLLLYWKYAAPPLFESAIFSSIR